MLYANTYRYMADYGIIKVKAVEIIRDYLGNETAKSYAKFYQELNEEKVLESVKELIDEYLGSARAKEVLDKNGLGEITNT